MRHPRSPRSCSFSPRIERRARSRVASLAGVRLPVRGGAIAPSGRGARAVRSSDPSTSVRPGCVAFCCLTAGTRWRNAPPAGAPIVLVLSADRAPCAQPDRVARLGSTPGATWRDRATRSRSSRGPVPRAVGVASTGTRRVPASDERCDVARSRHVVAELAPVRSWVPAACARSDRAAGGSSAAGMRWRNAPPAAAATRSCPLDVASRERRAGSTAQPTADVSKERPRPSWSPR